MNYTLQVEQKHLAAIFGALGELPLRTTYDLYNSLIAQVTAQDEAAALLNRPNAVFDTSKVPTNTRISKGRSKAQGDA